jgi:hypothetical protein
MDQKEVSGANLFHLLPYNAKKMLDPHFCRHFIEINLQDKIKLIKNKIFPSLNSLECFGKQMRVIKNNMLLTMMDKKFPSYAQIQ